MSKIKWILGALFNKKTAAAATVAGAFVAGAETALQHPEKTQTVRDAVVDTSQSVIDTAVETYDRTKNALTTPSPN